MATITEIGRMVVRLVGDAAQYAAMLNQVRADTAAAVEAVKGAFSELTGFFTAWAARAKEELSLEGILTSHGAAVTELSARYKEFAADIQNTTTVGYGYTLMLLRQAEGHGVSGAAAERAVKNAIAMGTVNNKNAQMYLRSTAALELGHSEMLYRTIPGLRGIRSEAERNVIAQAKLADMWGVVTAQADSSAGQVQQLSNNWKAFRADLGATVAEGMGPLIGFLKDLVEWLRSLPPWVTATVVSILALAAALTAITLVAPLVVTWFTAIRTAVVAMYASFAAGGLGLWVTLVGLAIAAAVAFVAAIFDIEGSVSKLNDALAKNKEQTGQMVGLARKQTQAMLAEANRLPEDERRKYLEQNLRIQEKNLAGMQAQRDAEKEKTSSGDPFSWIGRQTVGRATGTLAAERAPLEDINRMLPETRDRVGQLRAALQDLGNEARMARVLEGFNKLNEKLKITAATVGMTSTQQKIYQLSIDGASEAQIRQLRLWDEAIEASKERIRLDKDIESLNNNLEAQVATFGLATREANLYKLAMRGASDEQLEFARNASATMDQLEAYAELEKKAEAVTKRFEDPQEKFNKRMIELNQLLGEGLINWETYSRALEDARKHLEDIKVAARDAAAAASAEAAARVFEYTSRLEEQVRRPAEAMMRLGKPTTEFMSQEEAGRRFGDAAGRIIARNVIGMLNDLPGRAPGMLPPLLPPARVRVGRDEWDEGAPPPPPGRVRVQDAPDEEPPPGRVRIEENPPEDNRVWVVNPQGQGLPQERQALQALAMIAADLRALVARSWVGNFLGLGGNPE